jgi:uncharacterized protein (DUF4415 family)
MAKKAIGSSVRGKPAKKREKYMPDNEIDYSDIPALTDEELKKMKRLGRPLLGEAARQLIAIRIDPATLDKLRELAEKAGKGYQTLINEILSQYVDKRSA